MIESPHALDPPEPDDAAPNWHESSPFSCRYGHGHLIVFPDLIAFPVSPPWAVEPATATDPHANAPLVVSPAHLRMRVHYCEQCTYAELHYVRDEA